jgi:hypothetical protein
MTTRESLSSYARSLGWSVSSRGETDTYTAGDRSVFVDFADNGYVIGGGLHGELIEAGEDTDGWARYWLNIIEDADHLDRLSWGVVVLEVVDPPAEPKRYPQVWQRGDGHNSSWLAPGSMNTWSSNDVQLPVRVLHVPVVDPITWNTPKEQSNA